MINMISCLQHCCLLSDFYSERWRIIMPFTVSISG